MLRRVLVECFLLQPAHCDSPIYCDEDRRFAAVEPERPVLPERRIAQAFHLLALAPKPVRSPPLQQRQECGQNDHRFPEPERATDSGRRRYPEQGTQQHCGDKSGDGREAHGFEGHKSILHNGSVKSLGKTLIVA
jgi:hypothetical protein